ncbi:MAG: hypothetical protein JNL09_10070, partial [Anaerolineales bacterium]|nr:hypothetical protein [Anaerolineales bacterium]
MSLTELTLHSAAEKLRTGEISSVELIDAHLARIEAVDSSLRVFITVMAEQARATAKSADETLSAARHGTATPPPLTGLPLAIKDVLTLKGVRATGGSRILENFVAPYTATAVQRLLNAGGVVVGKVNCDEFAMGSSTENSGYFPTRNPWDTARVPGGSSGGSAAAVAAAADRGAARRLLLPADGVDGRLLVLADRRRLPDRARLDAPE